MQDTPAATAPAEKTPPRLARLERDGVDLLAWMEGAESPVPCRLVWLRPVHEPGGAFSVLSLRDRRELATLPSPDALPEPSRSVALEALAEEYPVPVILDVTAASTHRGSRTLTVETDRGTRSFALREPHLDIAWPTPDRACIRDVAGNRYLIPSLRALPPAARKKFQSIL